MSGIDALVNLAVQHELNTNPSRQGELEAASAEGPDALRRAVLDADELAEDDKDVDVVTKLLELGQLKREKLASLVASTSNADTTRRYAEEVEANQIAVRVLRRFAPNEEPTGGARFLLRSLDSAARTKCDAVLAAGEVPPFGGFSFLHPATCWRVYQARLFAKQVSTCSVPSEPLP